MTDPHEIIEAALADAHDLGMTDALYAKAIVRALEACFVIVDPDNVTDEMLRAFGLSRKVTEPWTQMIKDQISDALRAAPKWSKGSEG